MYKNPRTAEDYTAWNVIVIVSYNVHVVIVLVLVKSAVMDILPVINILKVVCQGKMSINSCNIFW